MCKELTGTMEEAGASYERGEITFNDLYANDFASFWLSLREGGEIPEPYLPAEELNQGEMYWAAFNQGRFNQRLSDGRAGIAAIGAATAEANRIRAEYEEKASEFRLQGLQLEEAEVGGEGYSWEDRKGVTKLGEPSRRARGRSVSVKEGGAT